jgi:hypothetical protein
MKKENERYKKEIQNKLNEPGSQIKLSASSQTIPQYIEVPPNIEVKQIVSTFSTVLFWQSNPSLLKDDFKLLIFPGVGRPFANTIFVILVIKGPKVD